MIDVQFDKAGYEKGVAQFSALLGVELGAALRDEARLLTTSCINRTPPFSGKQLRKMVSSTIEGTARQVGERRVRLDIQKVFIAAKRMKLYSESKAFRSYVDSGDIVGLAQMMKNASRLQGVRTDPDDAFHSSQRNRRGRVGKKPNWLLITNESAVEAYIQARQAKVGYMKSGWKEGARKFGAKVPGWIAKHDGSGLGIDHTRERSGILSVAVYNTIRGIQWAERAFGIARGAVRARQKAIAGKIRRIVNGSFVNSTFTSKGAKAKGIAPQPQLN